MDIRLTHNTRTNHHNYFEILDSLTHVTVLQT